MSLKKYDDFDFSMEEEENPVNKKDVVRKKLSHFLIQ